MIARMGPERVEVRAVVLRDVFVPPAVEEDERLRNLR